MKKVLKKGLCILMSLFLSMGFINMINPTEEVYAYGMTAAGTNDYTTWKQTSSSWGEATPWPNASIPKFGDAGCWITSVAILLRHYNVVTDSNVNTFNPLICNNRLMQYGIVNSAGDFCNLGNIKNAYPGFEYAGQQGYSLSNLKSLYDQGYACIVHETRGHYVAVRSVSSSGAVVMDPGYSTTLLTKSDTIQYYKVTAKRDTVNPTIEDVYVKDVSASGYTVHCIVRDDQALGYVRFPTWTRPNDQDDIIWGTAGEIAGKSWELNYRVNVSDHNNEVNCWYVTHIYCYDAAGNVTSCEVEAVFVENIPPVISDVKIENVSESGYTVSCVVEDAHSGVNRVQFPTWSHTNGQDDLVWHEGKISGNKATCRINVSDHKGYVNCTYQTDIYAYDKAGNCTAYINRLFPYIDATPPVISDVEIVDVSETGYTVKCKVTDDHSKIDRVQFPTWFEENNPFNADWSWKTSATYSGKLEDGKYVFRVNTSKYNNQIGKYHTDIYAWDVYGNCSKSYNTETIIKKAHRHDYISSIKKPATCTEPGIRLYTCKDNDDSYEETIPATGHQHTELRNVKTATCAQKGYTGDTYCKDCNTKLASGNSIAKKEHTWNAGKITTAATCSGKGIKTYTCTGCNATRTEEIPATGHQHTELRNVKAATCAQQGYTGDTYCKDCNTKLASGNSIAKKNHTWDAGKITTVATCSGKGIKTYTCTACNITKTEEIPATGHQHTELRNVKAATCAQEGYTGDTYCKDCNTKLSSGKAITKTEHTWDTGKITQNATCTTKGIKTYTCSSCGATRTEELEKLKPQTITPGKIIKDKVTNGVYKVQKDGLSVEFTKPVSKNASVKIPDTIKVNGITCKVTGISANAFKNNVSLRTVTIGKNVTIIGTNAFYGCKKLSKVNGANNVVKIGNNSFTNCGSLSSITVSETVRIIGKQAFYNCKNLKTITIKTSALSTKTIGSNAFTGTYKKPTIKVPAKQMKTYKKLFGLKGMSSKAIYKK